MSLIVLTKGKVTLVSSEDADRVRELKWHAISTGRHWYARRSVYHKGGKITKQMLANFILETTQTVDHINGDTLDNRRENLRPCTHLENMRNRKLQKNRRSSPFIGVSKMKNKKKEKWSAKIWTEGKILWLGVFESPIDAARAYDFQAKRLRGRFAKLNFSGG